MTPNTETLSQALSRVWETDWRHRRSGQTLWSQATHAAGQVALAAYDRLQASGHVIPSAAVGELRSLLMASEITLQDVRTTTSVFYREGLSPATIQKRLNCLSKLGVNVEGCRVKVPKQLKWHLKESDKTTLLADLRGISGSHFWSTVANVVEWTTLTGLRIEETIRLRWADVDHAEQTISVPGTKTSASQATLPFGQRIKDLLVEHWALDPPTTGQADPVFNIAYSALQEAWEGLRLQYGWKDDPTATLKALRRSAARYLHVDCGMPLHMVQQYLRHESMDTTLEYLRLTGGYGTEEMRRYLK